MTAHNSHIGDQQQSRLTALQELAGAPSPLFLQPNADQFDTKREQRFAFNEAQANAVNKAIDFIEKCSGKRVSVNRFVKTAVMEKVQRVLDRGAN